MESIKILIHPYLDDTTDFTFIYENESNESTEKKVTAFEYKERIVCHATDGSHIVVTDMEKEIIKAIIKNK